MTFWDVFIHKGGIREWDELYAGGIADEETLILSRAATAWQEGFKTVSAAVTLGNGEAVGVSAGSRRGLSKNVKQTSLNRLSAVKVADVWHFWEMETLGYAQTFLDFKI